MRVKVLNTTFQRDIYSKGLVETDLAKAQKYRADAATANLTRKNQLEMNTLKETVSSIQTDLVEIKELLKGLAK